MFHASRLLLCTPHWRTFAIRSSTLISACVCLGLAIPAAWCELLAADPRPAESLSDARRAELTAQRARHWETAQQHDAEGQLDACIVEADKMLALDRRLHGDASEPVIGCLGWIADREERLERFAAARKRRAEAVAFEIQLHGQQHWHVTDIAHPFYWASFIVIADPRLQSAAAQDAGSGK